MNPATSRGSRRQAPEGAPGIEARKAARQSRGDCETVAVFGYAQDRRQPVCNGAAGRRYPLAGQATLSIAYRSEFAVLALSVYLLVISLFERDFASAKSAACNPENHGGPIGQRAGIYARVSTSDQSCERQLAELTEFAARGEYKVVGVVKETASGTVASRAARNQIIELAQGRKLDAILVTELSRWGRSTQDLLDTLHRLAIWRVPIVAMSGMTFELDSPPGRMMATLLAAIAQFERDLLSERVKSGLAAARARGKKLGRQSGQRTKSDKLAEKFTTAVVVGRSYRWIAHDLAISKNTVLEIMKRYRQNVL